MTPIAERRGAAVPASRLPGGGPLARLARLALRRRGRVVVAWLALLVAAAGLAPLAGGTFSADYAVPGSDSKAAADLLAERFPAAGVDAVDVVWKAPGGVDDPAVQARLERFFADATQIEGIGRPGPVEVNGAGTVALTRVQVDRPPWQLPPETAEGLVALAASAEGPGLRVEVGGIEDDGGAPEAVGLLAAALVLLVAFGSLVAVGLPLVTALVGLGISGSLVGLAAAFLDIPDWAPAVAALIGIGVGIDYALLVVTRFRTELARGLGRDGALVEAMRTAGRSVLVAGLTVVVSLLGLLAVGLPALRGVAVAASLAVLVVLAASLTLLPALLAYAGERIDRIRIPGLARPGTRRSGSAAARWSRLVQRRPWLATVAGIAVLLALAAPGLGLRLGFPDAGNDPAGSPSRAAYDLVAEGFGPGANGPLLVAVDLGGRPDAASSALGALADRLRGQPGVASVSGPLANEAGDTAIVTVVPAASPQSRATAELVERARGIVAATLPDGTRGHVGGATASFVDESAIVADRLPLFIGGVLLLSLLFLLAAFRAPVVALKAGLLNLLSVGAAYGVVALFARGGVAGGLLGIDTETPVPATIPVMMFAVLFGLSMDYEIFLLSRVREELDRHGNPEQAVVDGVALTARVITAAAAIMVAVFLAFVFSSEIFLALMGVGMAAAILVDATVVRLVLVPALLRLLGARAWRIPARLDRVLPRLDAAPTCR